MEAGGQIQKDDECWSELVNILFKLMFFPYKRIILFI